MKCKKLLQKFFTSTISCMMAFSVFACSNGEEGGIKEVLVPDSEKITMTEFDDQISLLPWSVSQYLAAAPKKSLRPICLVGQRVGIRGSP